MWKLTVVRHYTFEMDGKEFNHTDEVYFESEYIADLEEIVDKFRDYGIGKHTYTITWKEK